MSRLAAVLKEARTDERKPSRARFGVTASERYERLEWQWATAYQVSALFAARVFVREPDTITPEQIRDAKRVIIEEVFGEFRDPINQIRAALYNWDIDLASELLTALQARMFEQDQ